MQTLNLPTPDMGECLEGDTFDGIHVEVLINNAPPASPIASVRCEVRKQKKTGTVLKTFTSDGGGITITDDNIYEVDQVKQLDLPAGTHYYDHEITFQDGTVRTYIGGTWEVGQSTTQKPS